MLNFTKGLKTLSRKPRAVDVGSVLIENETDEILKVHVESNLVVSAFQATQVSGENRTSSHGIGFTQDGFTTIRPRGKKVVKFTIPSMEGNSLVKCSITPMHREKKHWTFMYIINIMQFYGKGNSNDL